MLNIILFDASSIDFPAKVQLLAAIDILRKNNIEIFYGIEAGEDIKVHQDGLTASKKSLNIFARPLNLEKDDQTKFNNNDFYTARRIIDKMIEHYKANSATPSFFQYIVNDVFNYLIRLNYIFMLEKLQLSGIKPICIDDVEERDKLRAMFIERKPAILIAQSEPTRIGKILKNILNICDKMEPKKHSVLFVEAGDKHLHRLHFQLLQMLKNEKSRFAKQQITVTPFHFFTQYAKFNLPDPKITDDIEQAMLTLVDSFDARDFYKANPIIEEKVEGEKIGATLNKLLNRIIKTKTDLEINNTALQRTMKSQSQTPTTSTDTHTPLQSKPLTFAFTEEVFDLPPLPCLVEPMLSLKRVGLLS